MGCFCYPSIKINDMKTETKKEEGMWGEGKGERVGRGEKRKRRGE